MSGLPEGGWSVVPNGLLGDGEVTVNAIMTYVSLASWSGCKETAPSLQAIADRAKISRRSTVEALKILRATGWVETEARRSGNRQTSSSYRLVTPWTDLQSADGAPSTDGSECKSSDLQSAPPAHKEDNQLQEDKETSTSEAAPSDLDIDPEHRRLCDLLADLIESNGSKRPTVTKAWLDAVRLMNHNDGRTLEQIERCIVWCQGDEFWRGNVLSMPTLRKQYDKLRLAAQRSTARPAAREGRADRARRIGIPEAWA